VSVRFRAARIRIALSRDENAALANRMSLRPGLLWLTLDLILIIQCLSRNNIFLISLSAQDIFAYPLTYLCASPGVHVPQVEDHCLRLRYAVRCWSWENHQNTFAVCLNTSAHIQILAGLQNCLLVLSVTSAH
jgi:hypothetical protein